MLKPLNKKFAPKSVMPEKVIQFGEGNFLRAFVDWIIWNMDQKTNFNGSVVVVQPIDKGMVEWLNGQDCLYHVNLQGRENGKPVNTLERIDGLAVLAALQINVIQTVLTVEPVNHTAFDGLYNNY